jgi:outer membrane lipase/esterase
MLIMALWLPALVAAGPLIVNVYGDSLSDSGNMLALSGGLIPPPPYAGKASNGDVWVEQFAAAKGLASPNDVFATGALTHGVNNFAVMGAYTAGFAFPPPAGPVTSNNSNDRFAPAPVFPGLQDQVGLYAGLSTLAGGGPAKTVNVIWAGANDLVFATANGGTAVDFAAPAVANVQLAIESLIGLGDEDFVVMNLPDIGRTPFGLFQPDMGLDLSQGSSLFNLGLETMLTGVAAAHPGVSIDLVRIDVLFDNLLNLAAVNPVAAGFLDANAILPGALSFCLNQDSGDFFCLDSNPNDRVFFDVLHPSSRTHGIVASAVGESIVTSPATLLLLVSGFIGVVVTTQRRVAR